MPEYYFNSVNVPLIAAAYGEQDLDYYALGKPLKVFRDLDQNQRRLMGELWESIAVRRDQAGTAEAVIVTTNPKDVMFFELACLEREASLCSCRIANHTSIKVKSVEVNTVTRSLIIKLKDVWRYSVVVEALLYCELDFEEIAPDFNQDLPTINHDYLEQLKQEPLVDLARLLGAPVDPLLFILGAT